MPYVTVLDKFLGSEGNGLKETNVVKFLVFCIQQSVKIGTYINISGFKMSITFDVAMKYRDHIGTRTLSIIGSNWFGQNFISHGKAVMLVTSWLLFTPHC